MMLRKSWLWGGAALALGLALGCSLAGPGAVFGQNPVLPGVARGLQSSLSPSPISDAKLKVFAQALALIEEQYAEPKTTKDLVYGAIQGTLGTGIGIEIALKDRVFTVVSPIEGTPAYQGGLKPGDQIIKINGSPTKNITLMEAVKMIRGPKGSKVTLTINREGFQQPKDIVITREIIPIRSVKARILDDGIGYVRVTHFQDKTDHDLQAYLKKMKQRLVPFKGLVLDLRNDPGGLLEQAVRVSDEFLKSGLIVYTEGRNRNQNMRFFARTGQEDKVASVPMVVLINEGSASASEIVAGALKDQKRALIVGTKSFGKGSVQTIIPLEDGSALRLTTALYFTPSGVTINEKGIHPDVVVEDKPLATDKPLQKLRDELLSQHMRREGLTDKPWNQPITQEELDKDPQLKKAVEMLRNWPPKNLAQHLAPQS